MQPSYSLTLAQRPNRHRRAQSYSRPCHPTLAHCELFFRQLRWRNAESVLVAEEHDALALALSTDAGFDPLAMARASPQGADEANGATFGVGTVMLAHNWLDGLGGFVGVVEGDGADVVMKDVGLDNSVE